MEQVNDRVVGDKDEEIKNQLEGDDRGMEEPKNTEIEDGNTSHPPEQEVEEEEAMKKYGGILPKKKPLIAKDHERAFFDSADWALGKQGEHKPKGPLEALRPKLQPTPHQQVRARRSAYAPAHDCDVEGRHPTSKDECDTGDAKDIASQEQREQP